MKTSRKKILFFISGPVPSDADRAAAAALGTKMFRNALQTDERPEVCDAVAGAVPDLYKGVAGIEVLTVGAPAPDSASTSASDAPAPAPDAAPALDETATIAQIKAALDEQGIAYRAGANKTQLLALLRGE